MATLLTRMEAMVRGEAPPPPIAELLGIRITAVEPGKSGFEMRADRRFANPMGTLHGGVLCDLADIAMGSAYASLLEDGETFTTLELKINFLKPVWESRLCAEGRVVKSGRTVGLAECDITDEAGNLIARASCTCMTLRREMAEGR
jgi:uncharacterized protein (TIGR00369 family)